VSRGFAIQVGSLARRSIVRTLRQPASSIPPITFPLALMAVNAAGLDAATQIPGFPTDSFLAFALAVPFIQGALFATMNGGTDLARDIQTGFFNRLSLTPMHGTALLVGTLAGVVALGLAQAVIYLLVGVFVADVEIAAGFGGALVLLLLATLIALGFGGLGAMMALRTGSGEAVQGLFPALFVFLFISSMNMPRDLIEIDWFRIAATVNPVSYLLEGVRSLIIEGWDAQTLALGFGVALAVAAISLTLAALALRNRMERT
jgi:ABC-2 type transport system permease protein